MKKIIFFSLLWLTSVAAHSQFTDPSIIANTDYLQLSKKQKKGGWICIGAGVVFITVGGILSKVIGDDSDGSGMSTAGSFYIAGLFCIPLGIGTLVASSRNKRKGINLLLRKETVLQLRNNRFSYALIPALGLKISL